MKRFVACGVVLGLLVAFHSSPAQSAVRKVVLELFTSTTCPPCYNADVYLFETWLPQYANRSRVIPIAYHVWWPASGDPMYAANPAPIQTRTPFYQGNYMYVPRLYIDGSQDGTSAYGTWAGLVESRLKIASPVAIALSGTPGTGSVTIRAQIIAEQAVPANPLRVFWVVVEDSISAPQTNGTTFVPFIHEAAHRAMLPSVNGAALTITQGQTVEMSQTVTLSQSWQTHEVRVVLFVQDMTTKDILNAEEIALSTITDVEPPPANVPGGIVLSLNYPNPFNPSTTIAFTVPSRTEVRVTVHDLLGREVARLADGERSSGQHMVTFEASGLSSGVYYCRLSAGDVTIVRPMLLAR